MDAFNIAASRLPIQNITMLYGTQDNLTPAYDMVAFQNDIHGNYGTQVDLVPVVGTHSTDFGNELRTQMKLMIASLG